MVQRELIVKDPLFLYLPTDPESTPSWWTKISEEYLTSPHFPLSEFFSEQFNAIFINDYGKDNILDQFAGLLFKTEQDKMVFLLRYS
jgi:hypothetical protein